MNSLEGSVALITGGAGGIGLGVGRALAEAGARVVVTDIDEVELGAVRETDPLLTTMLLDVLDRDAWATVVSTIEIDLGPIDILVNNAGIAPDLFPLADMPAKNWDSIVAMNLTSVFNGVSAVASLMRARGRGHVVNVASMAGLVPNARLGGYTAAKFGVVGLSEVLRLELAPNNVGVSVVCPGMVTSRLSATTARLGLANATPPSPNGSAPAGPVGMDPLWVGRRVVEAIRANDLYVVTHPRRKSSVQRRIDPLLAAFDTGPAEPGFTEP
jgi:NAD(P)-dependent dehydrogenase (short-subunit alcohol dehydrogenase family)